MRVHLMGIGGAGVSALARVYLARGDEVSGCDAQSSDTTAELEDLGVMIEVGHDPEHVLGKDLLVYSGAVRQQEPELVAARSMGVEVKTRAEALAGFIAESDSIAIGGSHGKTTVTHMTGHVLTEAGLDPTVLVGDGSHSRAGRSRWLVAEVDESDGSLVMHHPKHAIVTNIELDHTDHFKDVDAVRDVFAQFIAGLPADGVAVLCADDERTRSLLTPAKKVTYGFSELADYRCSEDRPFTLRHDGSELGRINLRQRGRHNISNATAAAAMALEVGVSFAVVASALEHFPGAHRRMEFLGIYQGATVYDDYGHHPTEVRATLQAARELRHRRLIVVFQPHRYTRLLAFMDAFSRAFDAADRVIMLDVYSAGEDNLGQVSSRELAERIPGAIYAGSFERAREVLEGLVGPDDLLLLMGAGDIRKRLGNELAQKI
jgi:UDP-N-acetylmuramate--alanine ligase